MHPDYKSINQIANIIHKKYGYTFQEIVDTNRRKSVVEARNAFCFLLRNYLRMSYSEIARIIKRDHTSVMNAIGRFNGNDLLSFLDVAEKELADKINNPSYLVDVARMGKWTRIYRDRGGKCEIPGCGFDDVLEIHHLIPKKDGGCDDSNNIIVLCPNHHSMIHHGLILLNRHRFPLLKIPDELSTENE